MESVDAMGRARPRALDLLARMGEPERAAGSVLRIWSRIQSFRLVSGCGFPHLASSIGREGV